MALEKNNISVASITPAKPEIVSNADPIAVKSKFGIYAGIIILLYIVFKGN